MPNVQIKTPKGTRDWADDEIALRNEIFDKIRRIFELHGGKEIDTPVFELREVLSGKYGEDSRLIYDLQDQGVNVSVAASSRSCFLLSIFMKPTFLCALRYDLTIPFARWLGMNNVRQIKRFQIGKVYRRDQPAIARGRLREFYQCDFDYAGTFDLMVPDAEVLCLIVEVFEALGININIKLNHRRILDGIFAAVGVPQDKIRSISSAVDKLDKQSWEEVKKEMLQKGLDSEVADKLGTYIVTHSKVDSASFEDKLAFLKKDKLLASNDDVSKGIQEMELLSQYLNAYDIASYVNIDMSLARGLDYYTGLIYEVIPEPSPLDKVSIQVGSIAAGGRYDNLVGMFSRRDIPCVGISFGVDRILTILKARKTESKSKSRVDVWIIANGGTLLVEERMAIARELRQADMSVDFNPNASQKARKQLEGAEFATVAVYLEEGPAAPGDIQFKVLTLPEKNLDKAITIEREDMVSEVKKRLA